MKIRTSMFVSVLFIAALFMPTSVAFATPLQNADHFRLPADAEWADSGFFVEAGQQLTITAYGQAVTARINIFGAGSVSGPDGQVAICPNFDDPPPCAMENTPYGA